MAWDTDASMISMDATGQTAAGDGFEELEPDPLDFGDFGLLERLELRDSFLFEFLERAGVACLGFPAESS